MKMVNMKEVVEYLKVNEYVFIIVDKHRENVFVSDGIDPINPDISTGFKSDKNGTKKSDN